MELEDLEQFIEDIQIEYPQDIDKSYLIDIFGNKEDIYNYVEWFTEQSKPQEYVFLEALISYIFDKLQKYFDVELNFRSLRQSSEFLEYLIETMTYHGLIDSEDLDDYLGENDKVKILY